MFGSIFSLRKLFFRGTGLSNKPHALVWIEGVRRETMFGATTVTVRPVWSPSVTRHMFLCLRLVGSCTDFHFNMVRFAHDG